MSSGNLYTPRHSALPCELMRGCILADDFLTIDRLDQKGTEYMGGSIVMAWHGLIMDGTGYPRWPFALQTATTLSIMVQFATDSLQEGAILTCSDLLHPNAYTVFGVSDVGAEIWLTEDGVRAVHCDGATASVTPCEINFDYSDGETHTITYVIDLDSGVHTLYADSLTPSVRETTVANAPWNIYAKPRIGYTNYVLDGTVTKVRWFNALLTQAEHNLYHSGSLTTYTFDEGFGEYSHDVHHPQTLTQFMTKPYAVYRCDEQCDDTVGHKIWDRTVNMRDLYKGDQATASTFPTLATVHTGVGYLFDAVNDYISNVPTLPSTYTITACVSTPQAPWPEVIQSNDTATLLDLLQVPGRQWGYLHSLIIHEGVLTQLQLNHDRYQQLYWLWKGRAGHYVHRLISMGAAKMVMFPASEECVYLDYASGYGGNGIGITRDGLNGVSFDSSSSRIEMQMPGESLVGGCDGASGTITIFADPDSETDATFIYKGSDYEFEIISSANGSVDAYLSFNGSICFTALPDLSDGWWKVATVTFTDDNPPEFWVDGEYLGEGITDVNADDSSNSTLIIGNNQSANNEMPWPLKGVVISDQSLAPPEIKALHQSLIEIGATSMEVGNRIENRATVTGAVAVDVDITPGGPFQLIDVYFLFNTAPTTSENAVIAIRNSDSDDTVLDQRDLSDSTDLFHYWRFDSRQEDNRTIRIDYPNSDARTIVVLTQYQMDSNVV